MDSIPVAAGKQRLARGIEASPSELLAARHVEGPVAEVPGGMHV